MAYELGYGFANPSGDAIDSSGNGRDGTLAGNPVPPRVPGYFDNALQFLPRDDTAVLLPVDFERGGESEFTLMCWIRPRGGYNVDPRVMAWSGSSNSTNDSDVELALDSADIVRLRVKTGGSTTTYFLNLNDPLIDDEWCHLAVTFTSADLVRLYMDGQLDDTAPADSGTVIARYPGAIGKNGLGTRHYEGEIDEVRVYSHALSQPEIDTLKDIPVISEGPPARKPALTLLGVG